MHEEKHFTGSQTLRDIVIGMSDGLTVPFALTAGLSGAVFSNAIVLTAGIAEIIAGSIAMGLGGYLAGKMQADHYDSELKREYAEVESVPDREKQEIRDVLDVYGISSQTKDSFVEELANDKEKWVDFMMRFELGMEKPKLNEAAKSAGVIAGGYIAGGLVPLLPYFFTDTPLQALPASCIVTVIALLVFGYFKASAIDQPRLKGALFTASTGALAAAAAFGIAKLIGG